MLYVTVSCLNLTKHSFSSFHISRDLDLFLIYLELNCVKLVHIAYIFCLLLLAYTSLGFSLFKLIGLCTVCFSHCLGQ